MIVLAPCAALEQVVPGGGQDAASIETAVLEEAAVLDGHDRVNQVRRDTGQGDVDPSLAEHRRQRSIAGVEQERGLRRTTDQLEVRRSGQPAERADREA